jgi:hypothetical protein
MDKLKGSHSYTKDNKSRANPNRPLLEKGRDFLPP